MFNAYRGLDKLDPEMKRRVDNFLQKCDKEGIRILITETWRSKPRHLWLYAKGRTLPGALEKQYLGYDDPNIYSQPKEKQVTWTLKSNHLTGMAIDICFKTDTGVTYDGNWNRVFDIAESVGLKSLYRANGFDKPHLEFNSAWKSIDTEVKNEILKWESILRSRMDAAWKAVEAANEAKTSLAKLKGVEYIAYKIV